MTESSPYGALDVSRILAWGLQLGKRSWDLFLQRKNGRRGVSSVTTCQDSVVVRVHRVKVMLLSLATTEDVRHKEGGRTYDTDDSGCEESVLRCHGPQRSVCEQAG